MSPFVWEGKKEYTYFCKINQKELKSTAYRGGEAGIPRMEGIEKGMRLSRLLIEFCLEPYLFFIYSKIDWNKNGENFNTEFRYKQTHMSHLYIITQKKKKKILNTVHWQYNLKGRVQS